MLKLFLSILFASSFAFAVTNDAACVDFCKKCTEEQSELCTEIIETCQCNESGETVVNDDESAQAEEPEAVSETVEPAPSAPIMKASFAPPPEKKKKKDGAIMNVNFGYKGDSEYTAELQADGSYEMKEKSNTGIWVAIGGGIVLALVIILASL
jgi:hypothetical protein